MFRAGKFSVAFVFLSSSKIVSCNSLGLFRICAWNDNSRDAHRDLVDAPFRYASELETIMRRVILNNRLARADRAQAETSRWRHEPTTDPSHSITSSARARSEGGTSRPSALAVFRLMTSSNLVGCSIGSSDGLAPFAIRSMYSAARRYIPVMLGP